ncbi:hypothetical protein GCM10022393_07360 [Aquimarina addita]|uniref:DUF6973 domain-containing protein n=1 Tax=Aquimarina addita TaxID=870485 RepID=A0ABP7XBE5_9FLAO
MNIWKTVQQLSLRQLVELSILLLQKPLYILPTLKATRSTLKTCNRLYNKKHNANGRSNAFRHALWTLLICRYIFTVSRNEEKSVFWAKKITDLHEKLAPNAPLDMAMDLHNNSVGLFYFRRSRDHLEEEIIAFIQQKAQQAIKISSVDGLEEHKETLVYISEI